MYYSKYQFCLLIFPFLLTSCSFQQEEYLPNFNVEKNELNRDVYLYAEKSINSFKPSKELTLHLQIVSNKIIRFPDDFGLKVYHYKDSDWIEITQADEAIHLIATSVNIQQPTNEQTIILSPRGPKNETWYYYFYPNQSEIEKIKPIVINPLIGKVGNGVSTILVYIEGERLEKEPDNRPRIGAYKILTLKE